MVSRPAILYISYDGMLEPLGQSQVIAYLERLAIDFEIHLLSFEKPQDLKAKHDVAAVKQRIAAAGICWTRLRYHKSPSAPATAFDVTMGIVAAVSIALRRRVQIVHARSYIPAIIGLAVKRICGARLLFDMRGLWADERVDGGLWPKDGKLYRGTKAVERRLLGASDHIVTLTEASRGEVTRLAGVSNPAVPITVITTCTDLAKFHPPATRSTAPFVLGYVGSVGTSYWLDEMLRCFQQLKRLVPDARLLVVNRNGHDLVRQSLSQFGIDVGDVELVAADHGEVPALIGRMTAAMAFYLPAYSNIARAPTKLGEYLGCGVPCLGNAGVGDVDRILEGNRVGIALRGFSDDEIADGVADLVALAGSAGITDRCRAVAEELFSLDRGVDQYRAIYRGLAVR